MSRPRIEDNEVPVSASDGDVPTVDTGVLVYAPPAGGAPSGTAGGVLSGTYPNPGFAADMATQAELDAHVNDTTDAHDASAISFSPTGTIAATDVQAAIAEVATEASGGYTDEQARDAVAAMIAAGTHSGISFSYNDGADSLSATATVGGASGYLSRMAWAPYYDPQDAITVSSFALASGAAVAIPINLSAPGKLRSIFYRMNSTGNRTLEAGVYVQTSTGSGTCTRLASMASHAVTLSTYDQTDFDSQPVDIPQGVVWMVIRNTDAASVNLGRTTANALIGSARSKTGVSALGSTLDLATGWAGIGERIGCGLQFVTLGESALN